MVSDHSHSRDEPFATFLQLLHNEAEAVFRDADELREAGFRPFEVRGADFVVWEREGALFTTKEALRKIRPVKERHDDCLTLIERGFAPVQVRGSPSIILVHDGSYFTLEAALTEIRPVIEDDEEEDR